VNPYLFRNPYELSITVLLVCMAISLIVHFSAIGLISTMQSFAGKSETESQPLEVTLVDSSKFFKDSVETLQETSKEQPRDAKFVSTRNLKADEDTSPESALTPLPKIGGGARQKSKTEQKSTPERAKPIFSLSQKDIEQAERFEKRETMAAEDQGLASSGFYARLKKGQEFKVTAQESDYAQYIYRMKQKLIDRWSPQKLIKSTWYGYDEIRVDLGLVLDRSGEVVDLKITGNSRFVDYDQEALRAMRESGPFPNPPKSLIQDDGYIYIPWSFGLFMRSWGMASRGIE